MTLAVDDISAGHRHAIGEATTVPCGSAGGEGAGDAGRWEALAETLIAAHTAATPGDHAQTAVAAGDVCEKCASGDRS